MEVEQSEASPMLREDASYVMLSGTQGKMMAAQAMIVHTIAKTVDLKELVSIELSSPPNYSGSPG